MLETTIHKTQDEDKQNKIHNTICVRHQHTQDTKRRQTKQNTQHRNLNRWAIRTPGKKREWTQLLAKGKQFLFLFRHPPCYSYYMLYIMALLNTGMIYVYAYINACKFIGNSKCFFVFTYFLFYFLFLITVHSNPTFGVISGGFRGGRAPP